MRAVRARKTTKGQCLLCIATDRCSGEVCRIMALSGWRVDCVSTASEARARVTRFSYDVGLVEIAALGDELRDIEGICLLDEHTYWIALVSQELQNNLNIRLLIDNHFADFHTLPFDALRLLHLLGHAAGIARLDRAAAWHTGLAGSGGVASHDELVGASQPILDVQCNIRKIASVDAPVLINGESGTGKELAARAIHQQSRRAVGPFIAVNCSAMPRTRVELFGQAKDSFATTASRHKDCADLAAHGVLFLDEIGDLPLEQQTNLLQVLHEGTLRRMGGTKGIAGSVRVIASTRTDLQQAVADGRFRQHLFSRLNVLRLEMPPLRHRRDDIPVLAYHFFKKFSREGHHRVRGFSHAALEALAAHDWPGNVRELMTRVRRSLTTTDRRLVRPEDLGLTSGRSPSKSHTLREAREQAEKTVLAETLGATGYNLSEAARRLAISRPALYRMLDKYGYGRQPLTGYERQHGTSQG